MEEVGGDECAADEVAGKYGNLNEIRARNDVNTKKDGLGGGVDDRRCDQSVGEGEKERSTEMVETFEHAFTSLNHLDTSVLFANSYALARRRLSTPSPSPSFSGVDMRKHVPTAKPLEALGAMAEIALKLHTAVADACRFLPYPDLLQK